MFKVQSLKFKVKKYPFSICCIALVWILSLTPIFPETPFDNVAFIELVDFDENMLKSPKAEKKTRRSRKSAAAKAEAPAAEEVKAEEAAPAEAPAETAAAEEAKAE